MVCIFDRRLDTSDIGSRLGNERIEHWTSLMMFSCKAVCICDCIVCFDMTAWISFDMQAANFHRGVGPSCSYTTHVFVVLYMPLKPMFISIFPCVS